MSYRDGDRDGFELSPVKDPDKVPVKVWHWMRNKNSEDLATLGWQDGQILDVPLSEAISQALKIGLNVKVERHHHDSKFYHLWIDHRTFRMR